MHIVTETMPFYLFISFFLPKDQLHPFTVYIKLSTLREIQFMIFFGTFETLDKGQSLRTEWL
jgi:hypothetical protein